MYFALFLNSNSHMCTRTSADSNQKHVELTEVQQYLQGFGGQSIYMKSLMLRSSRAFLGGGGFLGLWATPGDICGHILARVIHFDDNDGTRVGQYITGAPGVAPVAGKPGLAMGIMGAPGAPGFR